MRGCTFRCERFRPVEDVALCGVNALYLQSTPRYIRDQHVQSILYKYLCINTLLYYGADMLI